MDWTHKFLITTEFREVDEPLYTAIQNFDRSWMMCDASIPKYVNELIHKVKDSKYIHIKRFLWISMMLVSPPMQQYVARSCNKGEHYANWWIKSVKDDFQEMLSGKYNEIHDLMAHITHAYVTGSFPTS